MVIEKIIKKIRSKFEIEVEYFTKKTIYKAVYFKFNNIKQLFFIYDFDKGDYTKTFVMDYYLKSIIPNSLIDKVVYSLIHEICLNQKFILK